MSVNTCKLIVCCGAILALSVPWMSRKGGVSMGAYLTTYPFQLVIRGSPAANPPPLAYCMRAQLSGALGPWALYLRCTSSFTSVALGRPCSLFCCPSPAIDALESAPYLISHIKSCAPVRLAFRHATPEAHRSSPRESVEIELIAISKGRFPGTHHLPFNTLLHA